MGRKLGSPECLYVFESGEPVAELLNFPVGYPEHVGSEGVRGVMVGRGSISFAGGGFE